jgi:hypothetical protein
LKWALKQLSPGSERGIVFEEDGLPDSKTANGISQVAGN